METNAEPMRALVQPSTRGPRDLFLSIDRPRPSPGPEEYLIRVGAAGVNFADVMQGHGTYGGGPVAPYTAGFEAAGEIVEIGSGVHDALPVGSHVIGTGAGAFAEYMVMAASAAMPVPAGWQDRDALGLVLNWGTAVAALRVIGDVAAGEVVLIHAAAGGVGQAAVRLALHYGARVVATASASKLSILHDLGATHVLDVRRADLATEISRLTGGVDLVLESVGQATLAASVSVSKPFTGRVVVYGAASGDAAVTTAELVFSSQVQIKGLHIGAMASRAPQLYAALLKELTSVIGQGLDVPGHAQVHPLADGPSVLRQLEAGTTVGKHALDPSS